MLKARIITVIIFTVISAINISANSRDQAAIDIAVRGLSQKLKADLALNSVSLKFDKIENQNISSEQVIVSGFGTVQNAKNIALTFDVVVNPAKADVIEVSYDIVTPSAIEPASATENFLMKKVMNKIKSDYRTEEIVMAIDGFQIVDSLGGKTNYVGVAEIRVGMEWNRIEFDVQGDAKTGAASDIKYKVVEE